MESNKTNDEFDLLSPPPVIRRFRRAKNRQYRLHPSGQAVGCLLGALLPLDPENPEATTLLTSPISHRDFKASDRGGLEKFVPLRPWPELVTVMAEIGGTEADLDDWVDSGLILRLPGSLTHKDFGRVFKGLAVVSRTACAARSLTDEVAELEIPNSEGTLPVSQLFYEALRISTGEIDLPSVLKVVCGQNGQAERELVGEVVTMLRFLISNRVASILRAM